MAKLLRSTLPLCALMLVSGIFSIRVVGSLRISVVVSGVVRVVVVGVFFFCTQVHEDWWHVHTPIAFLTPFPVFEFLIPVMCTSSEQSWGQIRWWRRSNGSHIWSGHVVSSDVHVEYKDVKEECSGLLSPRQMHRVSPPFKLKGIETVLRVCTCLWNKKLLFTSKVYTLWTVWYVP